VTQSADLPIPVPVRDATTARRVLYLGLGAALCLAAALLAPVAPAQLVLLSAGGVMGASAAFVALADLLRRRRRTGDWAVITTFLRNDPAPIFLSDATGRVTFRNTAAARRFPDPGGAAMLADLLAVRLPDAGSLVVRLRQAALRHGQAVEEVVATDGHLHITVRRLGAEGCLWRVLPRESSKPDPDSPQALPLLTADPDGGILYLNETLRRMVGGRAAHLDRLFADLPLRPHGVHDLATASGSVSVRVSEVRGRGARREICLTPCDPEEMTGASTRRFFDELPVALLKLDARGTVLMANRIARELLCHSMNGAVRLESLVRGLGRSVNDWIAEAAEGRGLRKPEVLQAARSESEVYLQITLNRILEDGEVFLVAVLNDATELKTLEAQFVQSQKMQAIGQLAGGVAHDFNNLLTAISGHCDLLLLRHDAEDPDYADLVQINQNANRAASLVSQLLAFSRKQTLQPEVMDLRDTLADLTHLLNRLVGERIELTLSHDPDLKPIRGDKRQLEQVIMNLIVNARDAMPHGGTIRIETRNELLSEDRVRDRVRIPQGRYVVVSVTDDGAGIPPDRLPKVFEPFYTTKRTGEGTGLGLSTAYGIVKQTGGFIFVDSTPGMGSVFTLMFPAHDLPLRRATPAERPARTGPPPQGEGAILLVEDEAPVRAFASRALRSRGYSVIEAESGEEALELLSDDGLEIDVFVTDVVMPGLDGPSWVRKALEIRPDVRVVFVSGYAEDAIPDGDGRIPNAVFLPKPFSLQELTATVQAQLV